MSKLKAIVVSTLALLFSAAYIEKGKKSSNFINLKKASAQEIENERCKQYDYIA